tara:strand:+ start:874 stop:1077 length:204 start_codon:yes stop_codon:yes gene_type:complete
MKARAIIIVDFQIDGGFSEAAEQEQKVKDAIAALAKDNSAIVYTDMEMKERRGDGKPEVSRMKFRTS